MKLAQRTLPRIFADEDLEDFVNVAAALVRLLRSSVVLTRFASFADALRSKQLSMDNYLRVANRNWYVMAPVVKLPPTRINAPRVY